MPVVEDVGPAFVRADACNGFSQRALTEAAPVLLEKVRRNGVAVLAIRHSHHFSALWPDVEPFAEQGLVALSFVNGLACVVPCGGHKPVFGTNPMAFATPRLGADPLVFDQASSSVANGDVRIAVRNGTLLPPDAGIDRDGQVTRSPQAILDGGALLPFGGYKGSSIALMIEVMGAALTGGQFSAEVDWSAYPGAETPRTGQLLIVIDPVRGHNAPFAQRVQDLCARVYGAGQERLPGDRRYACRRRAMQRGIPLTFAQRDRLEALEAAAF